MDHDHAHHHGHEEQHDASTMLSAGKHAGRHTADFLKKFWISFVACGSIYVGEHGRCRDKRAFTSAASIIK